MKKLAIIAAALLVTVASHAQGLINFRNRVGTTINAPFQLNGANISGANYSVELLIGSTAESLSVVATGSIAATGPGYVQPQAGVVVTGIAGGANAFAQIRAWDTTTGATYAAASVKGASAVFAVTLGGGGTPPGPANDLTGLGTNPIALVPEPSTIALAVLGGLALFFRRRK
jgi:hypothetical protein